MVSRRQQDGTIQRRGKTVFTPAGVLKADHNAKRQEVIKKLLLEDEYDVLDLTAEQESTATTELRKYRDEIENDMISSGSDNDDLSSSDGETDSESEDELGF